jgi:hypothetical protein
MGENLEIRTYKIGKHSIPRKPGECVDGINWNLYTFLMRKEWEVGLLFVEK